MLCPVFEKIDMTPLIKISDLLEVTGPGQGIVWHITAHKPAYSKFYSLLFVGGWVTEKHGDIK